MASWLKKNGPYVAVDFDGRTAHLVLAELVAQQVRILQLAAVALGPEVDLSDAAAVGRALKPALAKFKAKDAPLLMQVSRGQVVLKSVTLPAGTSESEMPSMVRYQVEKELPFRPVEAVIDFAVESHYDSNGSAQSGGVSVLVGAVRVPVADFYRQVAVAAGGKLRRLGLRPYACLRTLRVCGAVGEQKSAAFVHVGTEEAEIDVLLGDALAFSRSAPSKAGATDGYGKADAVASLVTEVLRSLQSYQVVHAGAKIEAIYLSGGTGVEPTLAQDLRAKAGVPCRVFNPAAGLKLLDDGTVSAFVPVLGLALGQAPGAAEPFDFANPKRPSARRDMSKFRKKAIAVGVAAFLAAVVGARGWYFSSQDAEIKQLEKQIADMTPTQKAVAELTPELMYVEAWQKSERNWLDHLANLSLVMPPAEDLYVTNLTADTTGSLTVNLRAKSDDVVRDLNDRLTKAGYAFHRGAESAPDDPYGYNFTSFATVAMRGTTNVDLAATQPVRPGDDASGDPKYKPPKPNSGGQPPRTPSGNPAVGKGPDAGGKVIDLSKPPDKATGRDPNKRPPGSRKPKEGTP